MEPMLSPTPLTGRAEFARAWKVIVAAAVGVGLGTTGLPIYTTGQFIRPLEAAYGWSRSATAGGLLFLTIGNVLMAPIMGALIERVGVRIVAMLAMVGLCIGYFGLTLNGGSINLYYVGWAVLAVIGAGTSPIVWTRAVASWFDQSRGLALGVTLCGTGVIAVIGPVIIGNVIAAYGWKAGFYVLSGAQVIIGLPLVFLWFRAREQTAVTRATPTFGMTMAEAARTTQFWRLILAFFMISTMIGGTIVSLPAMLADRGFNMADAGRALGLLGFAIIAGRLCIGWLVDRYPARLVAPLFILLPAISCMMLVQGEGALVAILLIGVSAGAEVDLLAYLVSRYFGLRHYSVIYGWVLSSFAAGAGVGPILAGWAHDQTGSYVLALEGFAVLMVISAGLLGSLGQPVEPVAAEAIAVS